MSELRTNVPPLINLEAEIKPAWLKGDKGDPGPEGPPGPQGEPGKSPRINESGNWETCDPETQSWTDTGINASGGTSYELATEADIDEIFEQVLGKAGESPCPTTSSAAACSTTRCASSPAASAISA